ncbi:hypothetical protein [Mangrovibacterium lignilyticum]|uniref:hypothetical protein n=1 Tax=Mangrovibacterium lignilyticum TaxID=2668052 RepID=UPI0013D0D6F9|nr:hypothetical protein [Mangrovibacterium lignilyticum]
MAKISGNPAVKGASGMVGGTLVYRKFGKETILASAPEKSSKEPSEKQVEQREKFRLANFYAARVKANPELLAAYRDAMIRRSYINVHSLIIADYFREPEIISFNQEVDETTSEVRIAVLVVALLQAKSVTLRIQTPDGTVLESGPAVMEADQQIWLYSPADPAQLASGNLMEVEVTDYPGHLVTKSFVL